ncbi:MAG: UDP-N-acetylmuramoylalanyl-D-glutamyl-2, 6-diaminopimelate--D-alanyl-D-alanine ligase, partial [Verrucomicrobia bacterium]
MSLSASACRATPMPAFDPQLLAADCAGSWTQPPRRAISGFAIDTRQLEPGELFVALRTERRDGHAFLG